MVWIALFLPVCIWLSLAVVAPLNLVTTAVVGITVFIYLLIEMRLVSRDSDRSRLPLWIMFMTFASVVLGALW